MSSATCSAVNGARACQRRNASDSTAAHSNRASNPSNCRTSPANVPFSVALCLSRPSPDAQARGEGQPSPLPVAAVLFIAGVARLPRLAVPIVRPSA